MGRGRIPMELIQKEKARKTTFQKRKSGLMKKAYELSTLCAVDVCMIIYAPNFEGEGIAEPETWPQDISEVHRIIKKYYNTTSDRLPKIYDVQEYYKEKIKKVEVEISKVRKEILKNMYPTWFDYLNSLRYDELRMFCSILNAKLDACNQKMNMLKGDTKGKAAIVEYEKPYLASYPNSHFNLMPQPHLYSQPSMLHYGQSGMTSGNVDHQFAMVKEDGVVESNQNSYYNGKAQSYPFNYFGNSDSLPTHGFQVNGFYDIDIFQPHMFTYMHERK